jgi:hypothetical protein
MQDESRDPELEWVRSHWDPPPPTAGFHDRVLGAYFREAVRAPLWRRWLAVRVPLLVVAPVAAAAVLVAFILGSFAAPYFRTLRPPTSPSRAAHAQHRYQPVSQPRFIVISQGEHP